MAGTVVTTEEIAGTVKKVRFDWTSDALGAADATTTNPYSGEVLRLVTNPDGGADAPDDNYSVVVNDADGNDILMGAGANRDTANTEQVLASSLGIVANDKLTLAITGAGAANKGSVFVYIR
jgi:hypothetical protein